MVLEELFTSLHQLPICGQRCPHRGSRPADGTATVVALATLGRSRIGVDPPDGPALPPPPQDSWTPSGVAAVRSRVVRGSM